VLLMAAKYDVPVCPHAGGVGLCQHVQHFSMFDFLRVSGRCDDRMIEYAGHLHEHFVEPLRVSSGRYHAPSAPGVGIEFKPEAVAAFSFPDGDEWKARRDG
jgi:L-fuconate dehydratase